MASPFCPSDVPKPVRDALFHAEANVDSARFTIDRAHQREAIAKILDDLEATLCAANLER